MSQSNFNTQIIKCLTKIDIKEGLLKNEAFYFSSVIILVELSSIIVAAFHGVKSVVSFIKELSKKNEVAIKFGENIIINKNYTKNKVLDSDKLMNNPPKKENDIQATNNKDDNNSNDDNYDKDILNNNKKNVVVVRRLNRGYI